MYYILNVVWVKVYAYVDVCMSIHLLFRCSYTFLGDVALIPDHSSNSGRLTRLTFGPSEFHSTGSKANFKVNSQDALLQDYSLPFKSRGARGKGGKLPNVIALSIYPAGSLEGGLRGDV